jgi:dihydrofolate reductase
MEIVYYVACSLDGYIAAPDGGVDWLEPFRQGEEDYGYAELYGSVEALLLGSRTYEVALSFGAWPSADKESWVFTRRELPAADPSVTLTSDDPARVIATLEERGMERAWLMGGGKLATSFREAGLITAYRIFVMPVVLGDGIPLFAAPGQDQPPTEPEPLKLVEARPYPSGVVELSYRG